jgi:hypothetical protein
MESSSCFTSDRGRVPLVMATPQSKVKQELLTITRVLRPLPLVEQELLTITRVTRPLPLRGRVTLVMVTVPALLMT